jgi:hypothetical protein
LWKPVACKEWKQHETWDGTYTLDDLADWHEMNDVRSENERLFQEWQTAKNKQQ